MATSGTNYTAKWNLQNGVLTIQPVSGNSGIMRASSGDVLHIWGLLWDYVTLTDEERNSVTKIVFSGNVAFHYKGFKQKQYERQKTYISFFGYDDTYGTPLPPNLVEIDVTGLDTTGATSLSALFEIPSLITIKGLSAINTATCTDFARMFSGTKLTNVDISTFSENMLNNEETSIIWMFREMLYCSEITLPNGFQRKHAATLSYGYTIDNFGISTKHFPLSETMPITKDGVTINSDEDFFKLTATSQGGTWTRDISGSAELKFNVNKVVRDGNSAEMQYTYYTSSATVEVYLKETNQSSFPSIPSNTFSIKGTGTGSRTLTLASDSAYDVMVKVYDGETTLYTYPSIDSNVLLFSVDEDGNARARGDIEDGQGNILSNKANISSLAAVATSGSYNDLSNKPTIPPVPNNYIIKEGTSSGWTYRKWNNGKVEAWYDYNPSAPATYTTWVAPIKYRDITLSIPSGIFSNEPKVFATSRNNQVWVVSAVPSATSVAVRLATLSSAAVTSRFRIYATNY